ncbi:major facilitator superfamily domain-containing protein [Zychaea mexicana]|uniref:major facilitator superfamily domain-containing protein n=1 Tax=Zychaea mexicana TaxID=64656 RepID=UPI0022FE40A4|nr:major facilitator superfamily domain-containing protein [Zychaea mexicana]KAI9489344.1 major facilitator superfamily domain-containing protein [Zychaea mexicana]
MDQNKNNEETTPLLHNNSNLSPHNYKSSSTATGSSTDDNDDRITILTSNPPSVAGSKHSRRSSSSSSSSGSSNEDTSASPEDDIVAKRLNGASIVTVLASLYVAVSLASLDASIVATVYAQIGTEFKRSNEIIWVATSYMLSFTALQPLCKISDVFGRKSALLFATIVFFIGSLLCGAAPNMWSLVAARAVAGLGGGGINTLTTVIVSDLVPLRQRGTYQGYGNMAYGLGSVIGGPLGGFITDSVGWRYCFYINLPILLITIYTASCILTNYNLNERKDNSTTFERLKQIDYLGAISIVSAVVAFLLATSMGGNLRSWTDPLVIGCLCASVVLAVVFCVIEANVARNPLMPWHIVTSQTPLACSLTNFWVLMCTTATIYITPLYFQGLLGETPTASGIYFLPKIASVSIGSVLSGIYMSRTGEYKNITVSFTFILLLAMMGYSTWTRETPMYIIMPCLLMDGFSMGVIITTTLIAMLSCVGAAEMATITSMSYLFRSAGGVIGISATTAIFQAVVKTSLSEQITGPDAQKYIDIARQSMTEIRELLPDDVLEAVLDIYEVAIRYAFLSTVVMATLALICTFFIQRHELQTTVRK